MHICFPIFDSEFVSQFQNFEIHKTSFYSAAERISHPRTFLFSIWKCSFKYFSMHRSRTTFVPSSSPSSSRPRSRLSLKQGKGVVKMCEEGREGSTPWAVGIVGWRAAGWRDTCVRMWAREKKAHLEQEAELLAGGEEKAKFKATLKQIYQSFGRERNKRK